MTGGLLQLVARGIDDIYITHEPEITLFKVVYRRYSNFSIFHKRLNFSQDVDFGMEGTCRIKRYADLVNQLYLVFELPDIDIAYQQLTRLRLKIILDSYGIAWNYSQILDDDFGTSRGTGSTIVTSDEYTNFVIPVIEEFIATLVDKLEEYTFALAANTITTRTAHNAFDQQETFADYEDTLFHEIFEQEVEDGDNSANLDFFDYLVAYKRDSAEITVKNLDGIQQSIYNQFVEEILSPTELSAYETYTDDIIYTLDIDTIKDSIKFYHVIDQANYAFASGSIGLTYISVFNTVIDAAYDGTPYLTTDAYKIYNKYFTTLAIDRRFVVSLNEVINVKTRLLAHIYWNISHNLSQFSNIASIMTQNKPYIAPGIGEDEPTNRYYRLGFCKPFDYVSSNVYNGSASFSNMTGNNTNPLTVDNFANVLTVPVPGDEPSGTAHYYGKDITAGLQNFNILNTSLFNSNPYKNYFADYSLWSRLKLSEIVTNNTITPPVGINVSDLDSVLPMNLIPLLMCDDIPLAIIDQAKLLTTNSLIRTTYIGRIRTGFGITGDDNSSTITVTIKGDLFSDGCDNMGIFENVATGSTDNMYSYLKELNSVFTPNSGFLLTTVFRPDKLIDVYFTGETVEDDASDVVITLDDFVTRTGDGNSPGTMNFSSYVISGLGLTTKKLTLPQYIVLRYKYEIYKITNAKTGSVYNITSGTHYQIVRKFMLAVLAQFYAGVSNTTIPIIPTYTNYVTNGFTYRNILTNGSGSSNTVPKYVDAVSTIWYNIHNKLITNFNNFANNTLLKKTYYPNRLGNTMKDAYANFDLAAGIPTDSTIGYNYYKLRISSSNSVVITGMISNYYNAFLTIYNNYILLGPLLKMKSIYVNRSSNYFRKVSDICEIFRNLINTSPVSIYNPYFGLDDDPITPIIDSVESILTTGSTKIYGFFDIVQNIIDDVTALTTASSSITVPDIDGFYYSSMTNPNLLAFTVGKIGSRIAAINNNNPHKLYNCINSLQISSNDTTTLYNDSVILAKYSNFTKDINVEQYLIDQFISSTVYGDILSKISTSWTISYDAVAKYLESRNTATLASLNRIALYDEDTNIWSYNAENIDDTSDLDRLIRNKISRTNDGEAKPKFAWTPYIAFNLIETISVIINGKEIEKHSGETLYLEYMRTKRKEHERGINILVGNDPDLYGYNSEVGKTKKTATLQIPLKFWFCKHVSESLPLVAMQHSDIQIRLKIKDLNKVAIWEPETMFTKKPKLRNYINANYIYVEQEERHRISSTKNEYLIETINYSGDNVITKNNIVNDNEIELELNPTGLCKNIMWKHSFLQNPSADDVPVIVYDPISTYKFDIGNANIYYNLTKKQQKIHNAMIAKGKYIMTAEQQMIYSWNSFIHYSQLDDRLINSKIIDSLKIQFNGQDREGFKESKFYSDVQPNKGQYASFDNGTYMYSFAINPRLLQPSGTANFTKIHRLGITAKLNEKIINFMKNQNVKINFGFYYDTYNILRITGGMCGLAFFGAE
jgi:hypothetical protein